MQKETTAYETAPDIQEAPASKGGTMAPISLEVIFRPTTKLQALGVRLGIVKEKRVLKIHPLTLGTNAKICGLLLSIQAEGHGDATALTMAYKVVVQHHEAVARIICMAVANRNGKYSRRLYRFVLSQFTQEALSTTLAVVYQQMGLPYFIQALSIIKGCSILDSPTKNN